jgi:hypothetical protein
VVRLGLGFGSFSNNYGGTALVPQRPNASLRPFLLAIMPRIGVDKQTGIQVAMKRSWINGTLFGTKGIRRDDLVEIKVEM